MKTRITILFLALIVFLLILTNLSSKNLIFSQTRSNPAFEEIEIINETVLMSTLSTLPRPVSLQVIYSGFPIGYFPEITVKIFVSSDSGLTYSTIIMTDTGGYNFIGAVPGFEGGTRIFYQYEAEETNFNLMNVTTEYRYSVFTPTGVPTLVVFNGFPPVPSGFPQDYYFSEVIYNHSFNFEHDVWAYGPLFKELIDNYTNILEICNDSPEAYSDSVIRPWLAADGNRNYLLAGQEWLGARYNYQDKDFIAGDFEYDVLGITHSYNDVSYDGVAGIRAPSLILSISDTQFGDPLLEKFNSLNPPADSILYNPDVTLDLPNWVDAYEVLPDVIIDIKVETRAVGGVPSVQELPTSSHRVLSAGNKIIFIAHDPLALATALNDSYPYYYWIGFDSASVSFQALRWFGVSIITDVRDDEKKYSPLSYSLSQNYPNPFNPTTKISWQSGESGWQILKVYVLLGNEVSKLVDEYRQAGIYEVEFNAINSTNGKPLTSGVYFYQLRIGSFNETRKMILIR